MSSHALVTPRKEKTKDAPAGPQRQSTRRGTGASKLTTALGGEPSVSLLPPEVDEYHKARATRRRLGFGVVGTLIVVALGIGGAYFVQMNSQAALDAARLERDNLLAQQAQFAELRQVQSSIQLSEAAQQVGASTEVDWKTYLIDLQDTLPEGVQINTVTIDSATPFADYAQATGPLDTPRIATLSFSALSPSLPSIPTWLDGLATLPGFADAVPDSVNLQEDDESYIVNITMHINSDAFSNRFTEVAP